MNTKTLTTIVVGIFLVLTLSFVSAVTIKDVSSSPSEVAPGETFSATIEIENILDYDITNLNVKLDLFQSPFAPYQSSSEKFLDELQSDDEEKFTFQLIVLPETASGIYKIPVEITYENDDEENKIKKETISLTVNSNPELKVSLEDAISLIKGKENEVSIRIVNSGLADVKFVYLIVSDTMGIKFFSEKEQYVGDIDSDDFDNVKYKTYISKTASNTISLPIVLKYRDATNKEFTETKTISLRTYSLKEAQDLGLVAKPSYTLYIIGGIVLVVYFIYRWRKKRKLRKLREGR